jgi:hypothetical protein
MRVSSRLAELLYQQSEPALARSNNGHCYETPVYEAYKWQSNIRNPVDTFARSYSGAPKPKCPILIYGVRVTSTDTAVLPPAPLN